MHDESAFKAANSAILGQIGQPPPTAVLVALVETVGGEPDVCAAVVDWDAGHTTWEVYACRGGILTHVHARKEADDWYGSGNRESDDKPAQVTAAAYRLADVKAITADDVTAPPTFEGFQRSCRARWSLRFDGATVELDGTKHKHGEHVENVARYVRDIFLDAAPRREGSV